MTQEIRNATKAVEIITNHNIMYSVSSSSVNVIAENLPDRVSMSPLYIQLRYIC